MESTNFISNQKGFTLIEIIVVVIIVGVLASFAITNFNHWIEASRSAEVLPALNNLANQITSCNAKYGADYTSTELKCIEPTYPSYPAAPSLFKLVS